MRWARSSVGAVVLALAAAFVAGPATAVPGTAPAAQGSGDAGRLLIFSVPGLTWADLERLDLPALEAFAASSGMADFIPRSVVHRSRAGDAYLTISAGTRSLGVESVDGEVLRIGEAPFDNTVGEVFGRRTGEVVSDGSVVLGWAQLGRRNDDEPYDAELGLLADTLAAGGVDTMVVGNADGSDDGDPDHQRQVGLALADSRGVVTDGELGTDLLTTDPTRPYGLRFDPVRVIAAFTGVWDRSDALVALVEASDVVRTMRYEPLVERDQYQGLRDLALQEADELFATLLAEVDPASDSVLVLGPYAENRRTSLTVAALRNPGGPAGYLRSATTQRAGAVSLVDVAPTILDTFGLAAPDSMEGRPFEVVSSSDSFAARVDHLVDLDEGSRFREHLLTPTTTVVVLGMTLVAAATVMVLAGGWSAAARARIQLGALVVLAVMTTAYLVNAFPIADLGLGFYWGFVLVGAVAVAIGLTAVARRAGRPRLALVVMLALLLGTLVLDVMTGSNLSLNSAFGYSPTSNSRLYGVSNYSYGQVAGSACLLAGIVGATEGGGRRRRLAAIGLLGAVVIVLGVPVWGSDVGGVLAFTPAVLLFAALVLGYRIRIRAVLLAGVATVAAITAFGFLDLSRPEGERAHLGRLFERIDREGLDPLISVVERKLVANLEVTTSSFWVLAVPISIGFWAFLARHRSGALAAVQERIPTLPAALAAAAVAALLGSILNDSGAIVGGVTLTVVAASLAHLAAET